MPLTLVTAPEVEPITLTEAKLHLRVTENNEDALISALIIAAREGAESFTRRAIITQTWDLTLDEFPEEIETPFPKLQSVSSVTYIDTDGNSQTLNASEYTVDTKSEPGRVVEAYGKTWPSTRDVINAVTVRFVAGYGLASAVPKSLVQGMLMHIGHMYANRESVNIGNISSEIPMSTEYLYLPHRVYRF